MSHNVNPNINRIIQNLKRKNYSVEEYLEGILSGNRNMLSQAITLLESMLPQDNEKAEQIIKECLPYCGKSQRIGITGVPGVGKSTFIDYFGVKIVEQGHKLAILAIDPSSGISGGSILGDKTRMETLTAMQEVFIRPSPSQGTLGGVAAKTRETIVLCEAAGFDTILVETVGVGQSEYAVASMVDLFMFLIVAGTGDELQGIKRGIMEMCDIVVFTKDDGDNKIRTNTAKRQMQSALQLLPPKNSGWMPKVTSVSSLEYSGFDELNNIIDDYFDFIVKNNFLDKNRNQQSVDWFYEQIVNLLKNTFFSNPQIANLIPNLTIQIKNNEMSPIAAARQLVDLFSSKFK